MDMQQQRVFYFSMTMHSNISIVYIWSFWHIIALFSFYITFFILSVIHLFSLLLFI